MEAFRRLDNNEKGQAFAAAGYRRVTIFLPLYWFVIKIQDQ